MGDSTAYEGLATLDDGKPPETRMENAQDAISRIQFLMRAEMRGRTQRRALVKGLVDGNPPYNKADMQKNGRAHQCNVNWRVAEYYLNHARSAFYDIFSEAPSYATIRTSAGNPNQKEEWSQILTEEWDRMVREDRGWDYSQQISQYEMILYGAGPLMFEDDVDWRNYAVLNRDCIVPDYTKSDTTQWEELVIRRDYSPDRLFSYIQNAKIAQENGWDVPTVRKAIMDAHPKTQEGGQYYSWEWHQSQLKNQSFGYTSQCKVISCSHYFFREFPEAGETEGKITHTIVINPEDQQTSVVDKYLFKKLRRFSNWDEVIHPMYYDNDGGGYHHSVTGLGVKMYSAMEYQNRLKCNLADKVFTPKIMFRPTTANAGQSLSVLTFNEYGQIPSGFEAVQMPTGSFIEEGLVLDRELTALLSSNLSQYNQSVKKQDGNPITATQAQIDASEQARLGKTQLNHYYCQYDRLLAEKYRRSVNSSLNGFMPGGREALAFQKRCLDRGVPLAAIRNVESVKATRIIGQGSQFMRQQAINTMMGAISMFPSETGRNNLINDFIASWAGQYQVGRYNPAMETSPEMQDQYAFAMLQVASAKDAIPPVVTGSQNHFVFAGAFLQAAVQATESLEQGGNPMEVYSFIETIGPAIAQHLQYLKNDPTRKQAYQQMEEQWKKIAQFHDKLGQQIEQMQQQQAEQAQMAQQAQRMQQGQDPEMQLKAYETQAKIRMQQEKTDAALKMKQEKHNQSLILSDSKTASSINNQTAKTKASESSRSQDS